MTHLTPDELIDTMEGVVAADRRSHLASCDDCRRQLAELSSVLGEAQQAGVPEPSPLFWQHFSQRVRTAIDDEPETASWPSWLRWQVLLPLGAAAMIILALMLSVPRQDATVTELAIEEPAPAVDDGWALVAELVGDFNLEAAAEAGVALEPGLAERAVLELTADEQQELTRLLKAELARAKS